MHFSNKNNYKNLIISTLYSTFTLDDLNAYFSNLYEFELFKYKLLRVRRHIAKDNIKHLKNNIIKEEQKTCKF